MPIFGPPARYEDFDEKLANRYSPESIQANILRRALGPYYRGEGRSKVGQYATPEEEESVFDSLKGGAMSALATTGEYLDKYTGSRALRGVLAGRPRELLSIIPGSDAFGLTDPKETASGKDVLRIQDDPNSWADDIAEFATEAALDPTLFLSGFLRGGLSASGKLMQKAGSLDKAILSTKRLGAVGDAGKVIPVAGRRQSLMHTTPREWLKSLSAGEKMDEFQRLLDAAAGSKSEVKRLLDQPLGGNLAVELPFGLTKNPLILGQKGGLSEFLARHLDSPAKTLGNVAAYAVPLAGKHIKRLMDSEILPRKFSQYFERGVENLPSAEAQANFREANEKMKYAREKLAPVYEHAPDMQALENKVQGKFGLDDWGMKQLRQSFAENVEPWEYDIVRGPAQRSKVREAWEWLRADPDATGIGGMRYNQMLDKVESDILFPQLERSRGVARLQDALNDPALMDQGGRYWPREPTNAAKKVIDERAAARDAAAGRPASARTRAGAHRELRDMPFGISGLEGLVLADPAFAEAKLHGRVTDALGNVKQYGDKSEAIKDYLVNLNDRFKAANGVEFLPAHVSDTEKLDGLATLLASMNKDVLDPKIGMFRHPLESVSVHAGREAEQHLLQGTTLDHAARGFVPPDPSGNAMHGQPQNAYNVLESIGLKNTIKSPEHWQHTTATQIADRVRKDYARRNMKPPAIVDANPGPELVQKLDAEKMALDADLAAGKITPDEYKAKVAEKTAEKAEEFNKWSSDFLSNVGMSQAYADDLRKFHTKWRTPEHISDLGQFFDSLQNVFKAGVLTRPARFVRDRYSGLIQGMMDKQFSPSSQADVSALFRGNPEAVDFAAAPAIKTYMQTYWPGLKAGTPEYGERAQRVGQSMLAAMGVHGVSPMDELAIAAAKQEPAGLERILEGMPGREAQSRWGLREAWDRLWKNKDDWKHPLSVRGTATEFDSAGNRIMRSESLFPPVAAGEIIGQRIDAQNRLAPLWKLIKEGYSPAAARDLVQKSQVDYMTHTDFERNIMKRLFPFYSFSSRVIPHTIAGVLDNPAGPTAQFLRMGGRLQRDEEFLPQHMRTGSVIPLPFLSPGDGRTAVLSSLGLMPEEVLSFVGRSPTEYGKEILGRLRPELKGAVEWGTGQNLFTGQEMRSMQSPLERTLANLFAGGERGAYQVPETAHVLLGNSPLAAYLTMARQGSELVPAYQQGTLGTKAPQTLLNWITGLKIRDEDMARNREMAKREALDDYLRSHGGRVMKRTYMPDGAEAFLSPQERLAYMVHKEMERRNRQERK